MGAVAYKCRIYIVAHVSWAGSVLTYADPSYSLTTAGEELDHLDHDLSVDYMYDL